jgi:hypothetical protein
MPSAGSAYATCDVNKDSSPRFSNCAPITGHVLKGQLQDDIGSQACLTACEKPSRLTVECYGALGEAGAFLPVENWSRYDRLDILGGSASRHNIIWGLAGGINFSEFGSFDGKNNVQPLLESFSNRAILYREALPLKLPTRPSAPAISVSEEPTNTLLSP